VKGKFRASRHTVEGGTELSPGQREVELGTSEGKGRGEQAERRGGRRGPHGVTFAEGGFYVASRGCSQDKAGEVRMRGEE
jgi:hypothetical protein